MTSKTYSPTWAFDDTPIPDPAGRAARMLKFADILQHPKAMGPDKRPLQSYWQRRLVERIYGPCDDNGQRQIKTVFALLPRGARKTTIASVLALGHTIGPEQRKEGQIISAASDRTQARLAFDEACSMINADDRLVQATHIRDSKNRIEHKKSGSSYTAVSAEGDAQHGKTPSLIIADELHVWRGYDLWSALKTGASKTPGSLTIAITTAGGRPEGLCWELFKYSLRVMKDPSLDPSFLPIIFAADPSADWEDEDLWHQVNPGLAEGFPDLNELRAEARQARLLPPLREAFKQTHLNIWSDGSVTGWIEMAVYDEGAGQIDLARLEGEACWIGVDMARSYDLTAIVAAFPDDDGGFTVLTFAFLPEAAFRRRRQELPDVPWDVWRESGALTVTPGDMISDDVIADKLREMSLLYDVREIAFDPKFAGRLMSDLLAEDLPVVECQQRPPILSPYYVELQRLILARKLRHGGNPVLRWCVSNAAVKTFDTGLIYISKSRSVEAVDALVACAMATGRAAAEGGCASVYDSENDRPNGLLFI